MFANTLRLSYYIISELCARVCERNNTLLFWWIMAKSVNKKDVKKEKYSGGFTDVSGRDGFYRPKIEVGRWALGMEILRGNFAKLIGFNLFMLIFVGPVLALIAMRYASLTQAVGNASFAANVGLGFQPSPNMLALPEELQFSASWAWFIYLPLAIIWLGVGLSGGMFVMRNLAWGERVRVYKAFWTGIKRNALTIVLLSVVYGLILASSLITLYYTRYVVAVSGSKWYHVATIATLVVLIVFSSLWYLMGVSMGVTYNSGFFALTRNSLLVTAVLLPLNLFFAAFGGIVYALFALGSSFLMLAVLFGLLLGSSFFMLVWTVYSQWVFDKFINPNIKNKYVPTADEIEAKKIRDKLDKQAEKNDGFVTVGQAVISDLGEIKPIAEDEISLDLGGLYTRDDVSALSAAKKAFAAGDGAKK